jgi:hypothetical protein
MYSVLACAAINLDVLASQQHVTSLAGTCIGARGVSAVGVGPTGICNGALIVSIYKGEKQTGCNP